MTSVRTLAPLPVSAGRLWFGVLAAPAAWSVAGLADYVAVGSRCRLDPVGPGHPAGQVPGVAIALTVLALVIAGAALVVSWSNWNRVREDAGRLPRTGEPSALGRARFLSFAGMLGSILFLLGIVLLGFPSLVLNPCTQVR